jgi:hypothetical protein
MVAAVWAVIGILGALLIAVLAESRSDRRAFGAKFDQLEARIGRLVSELGARIDGVRDGLETKLGARIDGVRDGLETKLGARIDGVREGLETKLGARIDGVRDGLETKLGARIDGVETQLRRLADAQAEMNGQLVVLRQMAHTHNAA